MNSHPFTQADLMDILVSAVGLPQSERTDDATKTLTDVGLDSLALLQLQAELLARYGVEVTVDHPQTYTFGEIVACVRSRLVLVGT
jgi:minimal PKS acyl carrier protein